MDNLKIYIHVINKETFRAKRTLYQNILLKKASSVLINEMVKHDSSKRKAKVISSHVTCKSNVSKVAKFYLHKGNV